MSEYPEISTPVPFRLQKFTISSSMISDGYISLSSAALSSSVDLLIDGNSEIISWNYYAVILVNSDNISEFPKSTIGCSVVTWLPKYVEDTQLVDLLNPSLDRILQVKYVISDFVVTEEIVVDDSDTVNWDNDSVSSSSSILWY